MSTSRTKYPFHATLPLALDIGDTVMVNGMRLVLAFCVLLTVFINTSQLTAIDSLRWMVFGGFVAYSFALCICSVLKLQIAESKAVHWLDVFWYGSIVLASGGANSIFFALFFFAIFCASFRWGFEEGARITIASVVVFACSALAHGEHDLPNILLRSAFMLAFGYMSARWGESKLRSKRRLVLLNEVTRLSNPRFGISQTIASLMEKSMTFFNASGCLLVTKDKDSDTYSLRIAKEGKGQQAAGSDRISNEAASPFIGFPQRGIVIFSRSALPFWPTARNGKMASIFDLDAERWAKYDVKLCEPLVDLLEADAFMTAPVALKNGTGRIYVLSRTHRFRKADAQFLNQITAHAFPVIENVALLDQMASAAALQERKKIAWDIHDTAIQPYVGLSLGLSAMRLKATADNPLAEDLEKLMAITTQTIGNLRHFAGTITDDTSETETALVHALRTKADHVREFYGIDIDIAVESDLSVGDRLCAEVLHLVNEGLSNICRHTAARRGMVTVGRIGGWLKLEIENENSGAAPPPFEPRSITERVAALGGSTHVIHDHECGTTVHVEIPV